MKKRQGWLFFIIFLLTLSVYLLINYPLQLGLDLQGGSQLTLQIIKEEGKVSKDELEAVNSVIDKRVNNLGVSESNLQTLGGDQLILELPGEQNPLVASRVLGKTALLEFRTQKEGTSTDLKTLQLQRLSIKEVIEQYSFAEKNQNENKSRLAFFYCIFTYFICLSISKLSLTVGIRFTRGVSTYTTNY